MGARVPLHRALHVARLALLVLGAVAAGDVLGWWARPWPQAIANLALAAGLLFVVGGALPRSLARLAPEVATAALPPARRTPPPFPPPLWVLALGGPRLHPPGSTPRPLPPQPRGA